MHAGTVEALKYAKGCKIEWKPKDRNPGKPGRYQIAVKRVTEEDEEHMSTGRTIDNDASSSSSQTVEMLKPLYSACDRRYVEKTPAGKDFADLLAGIHPKPDASCLEVFEKILEKALSISKDLRDAISGTNILQYDEKDRNRRNKQGQISINGKKAYYLTKYICDYIMDNGNLIS
ncbi:hypothetical protein FOL47_009228 [Perkinsus chesapeaki]|uniref:Uncharacterized protein n=1 Tax=Perkinsus chesapeaki TaxID=330153 RepID=A0A7J6MS85_PERCH|nr:hypothetical protein FOL47_009228 [Perkinsus chesapeaki]